MRALPVSELYKITIKENNEPLDEIKRNDKVELLSNHQFLIPKLRQTVCNMLYEAANNLPPGHKLLVVTAYRPRRMQEKLWKQRLWQMGKKHPLLAIFRPKKFRRLATKYTAPPGGSFHQCGTAVDVGIIAPDSTRLDMGTSFTEYGKKCHTDYPNITEGQKRNRKILYEAMTKAGFINYPLEWWHYSYGDRHWAAHTGRTRCPYGPLQD